MMRLRGVLVFRHLLDGELNGRSPRSDAVRNTVQFDNASWKIAHIRGGPRQLRASRNLVLAMITEFDEIGMAKPFAVVENRDHLGGHPKQHYVFQLSRRVACDLREFLEHQLARLLRLLWVGDPLGPTAERQTTNVVPARVWQIYGERDLIVASKIFRLLRVRRTTEIDREAMIDLTDRRRLWIAVFPDSRDRHVVCVIEN